MKIFLFVLLTIMLALPIKAQENETTLETTPPPPSPPPPASTPETKSYVGVGLSPISIEHGAAYDFELSDGSTIAIDDNDYYVTSSNMIEIVYGNNFSENKAFEFFYSRFDGSREAENEDLVWVSNGKPVTVETSLDYTAYGFSFLFYKPLFNTNTRFYGRVGLASVTFGLEKAFAGGSGIPIIEKASYSDIVTPYQIGIAFDVAENLTMRIGYHAQTLDFVDGQDADGKNDDLVQVNDSVKISGIMLSINNKF